MGGEGSYVEFRGAGGGSTGGPCTLSARYSNGGSASRPCEVKVFVELSPGEIEATVVGTFTFPVTDDSWSTYLDDTIETECPAGDSQRIRITAETTNGGPNLDMLEYLYRTGPSTPQPTASPNTGPVSC